MKPLELHAERRKELRGKHPLYTRLSGEVIWELLLECDYTDAEAGDQLDTILAHMHETLGVMDLL